MKYWYFRYDGRRWPKTRFIAYHAIHAYGYTVLAVSAVIIAAEVIHRLFT